MRGKKTGGRNFVKGDPRAGRRKGSRDKVPRTFKASIRAIYERIASSASPTLFEKAIRRDLKSTTGSVAFQHVQLAAYYIDGKPAETVNMQVDLAKLSEEQLTQLRSLVAIAQSS